jgi:hypothetical protein
MWPKYITSLTFHLQHKTFNSGDVSVTLIRTSLSQAQRAPWVPQGSSGTKYEGIIE